MVLLEKWKESTGLCVVDQSEYQLYWLKIDYQTTGLEHGLNNDQTVVKDIFA